MSSLTLTGLLTRLPVELPPRGEFTQPAKLLSILDEESGEVFQVLGSEAAAEALGGVETPCHVSVGLRASLVRLADVSNGATKGRAYRLRAVSAEVTGREKR